jgi:hypothetical protein
MMIASVVKPSFYQDSLTLLRLGRALKGRAGVDEAAALMGTPANRQLLADGGLLTRDGEAAGPNDLVIAVRAASHAVAAEALARAEAFFTESRRTLETAVRVLPRTLDSALRHLRGGEPRPHLRPGRLGRGRGPQGAAARSRCSRTSWKACPTRSASAAATAGKRWVVS